MRARFQTTANHMMLNINLWSTLVLGLGEPDGFRGSAAVLAGLEEETISKITFVWFRTETNRILLHHHHHNNNKTVSSDKHDKQPQN